MFDKPNNTYYTGEQTIHNFENLGGTHLEAHRLLFEAKYNNGLEMDNTTKIQHFQSGIKSDAGLKYALTTTKTNKLSQGGFQFFISFLSAEVDNKGIRKNQLSSARSRMIPGLEGGFRGVRGGKYPFRGRGKGRGLEYHRIPSGTIFTATVNSKLL